MNQRERILGGFVLLLVGYLGFQFLYKTQISGPMALLVTQEEALFQQLKEKQATLETARKSKDDIERWRQLALPADVKRSQNLYNTFVTELLTKAGIERPTVTVGVVSAVRLGVGRNSGRTAPLNNYVVLPFSVKAQCSPEQLTKFLHSFYKAKLLHRITRLQTNPIVTEGALKTIDVALSIEAVSMPDAAAIDALPKPPDKLVWRLEETHDWNHYTLFPTKNVFQPTQFVKKDAPPPIAKSDKDDRKELKFIAAIEEDGVSKLWLKNQKTNQLLIVQEGENLSVPGMKAVVKKVSPVQTLLEVEGKLGSIQLGEFLNQWAELKETERE